jgi:hypothetical protein
MDMELDAAVVLAIKMLEEPSCAGLFGMMGDRGQVPPDPATVLTQLLTSNDFSYKPLGSSDNTVTSAQTTGVGSTQWNGITVFSSVSIVLNNQTSGASFVSGTPYEQAITVLHELGHAYWDLYGGGTSLIMPDSGNTAASMMNTNLLQKDCK